MELLSPAGDFAALNAAIRYGADSVYIGIAGFNLRAHKGNFQIEDLKEAVKRCHDSNVKLYVCTNTIMKDKDIENLKKVMPRIKSAGADAIIASDLGALNVARDNGLNVHMSVQSNISNLEALQLYKELGVTRVVLSRELSLNEIKRIKNDSPLEVEVFVHGAMCLAVSGRCFLSSYFYSKSANCGECLQPCRKKWKLVREDKLEFDNNCLDIDNNVMGESHFLSPRDLCMLDHIPELIESGIDSFKIEGRSRAADYVATVTRVYREAIEAYLNNNWKVNPQWLEDLKKVYNRGFDTGFYFKSPYKTSKYNQSTHTKKDIALVTNFYSKVSVAELKLYDDLTVNDELIIIGPTTGVLILKVESMQINKVNVTQAFKGEKVAIKIKSKVRRNDIVYKRIKKEIST
ncbi:MAG: U32 family peptidase [Methanobacterium sp.]